MKKKIQPEHNFEEIRNTDVTSDMISWVQITQLSKMMALCVILYVCSKILNTAVSGLLSHNYLMVSFCSLHPLTVWCNFMQPTAIYELNKQDMACFPCPLDLSSLGVVSQVWLMVTTGVYFCSREQIVLYMSLHNYCSSVYIEFMGNTNLRLGCAVTWSI